MPLKSSPGNTVKKQQGLTAPVASHANFQGDKMRRVGRFIENVLSDKVSGDVTAWIVFGALCLVLAEVVTRYFFNRPLGLADEFGGYALVAITFLGLAYTLKEKAHVRVTMVVDRLPPQGQKTTKDNNTISGDCFYSSVNLCQLSTGGVFTSSWYKVSDLATRMAGISSIALNYWYCPALTTVDYFPHQSHPSP